MPHTKNPPPVSDLTRPICPICDSTSVRPAPSVNPQSALDWFECNKCGHLWSLSKPNAQSMF
jgi:hypothetical protein